LETGCAGLFLSLSDYSKAALRLIGRVFNAAQSSPVVLSMNISTSSSRLQAVFATTGYQPTIGYSSPSADSGLKNQQQREEL